MKCIVWNPYYSDIMTAGQIGQTRPVSFLTVGSSLFFNCSKGVSIYLGGLLLLSLCPLSITCKSIVRLVIFVLNCFNNSQKNTGNKSFQLSEKSRSIGVLKYII